MKEEEKLLEMRAKIERERAYLEEQRLRVEEDKLPFFQRLQLPHNLKRLQSLEVQQEKVFRVIVKRRYPISSKTWNIKEEFATYFTGFLNGEYKSINDYLAKTHPKPEQLPEAMFYEEYVGGRNRDYKRYGISK